MEIRIGILQCDHVDPDLNDEHGDYADMFSQLMLKQDDQLEISLYDLPNDLFPIDLNACDGYIITGSRHSAYDDIPWIHRAKILVQDLYKAKIPTIGICFGHQIIAEALGGKVEKAEEKGWGVGVHQWEIKNKTEWMSEGKDDSSLSLLASHQDQVVKMPEDSTLIASSDFCPIAGFQTGSMLAMQGHPEFSANYTEALISSRLDRIDKNTSSEALSSLSENVDSMRVGAWMIEFIKSSKQASK